jgi:hypothetical protein
LLEEQVFKILIKKVNMLHGFSSIFSKRRVKFNLNILIYQQLDMLGHIIEIPLLFILLEF